MARRKPAFSLLEVLVIIIIISTLALFGHSSYVGYVQRSKVTEALHILEEYQAIAMGVRARSGSIAPYYVLFTDANQSGYLTGTPAGSSASKTVDLEYVDTVLAYSGTDGSGNDYILLGAKLKHDNYFVNGADTVYTAGVITEEGVMTWSCGISTSHTDTIEEEFLPQTCLATLP